MRRELQRHWRRLSLLLATVIILGGPLAEARLEAETPRPRSRAARGTTAAKPTQRGTRSALGRSGSRRATRTARASARGRRAFGRAARATPRAKARVAYERGRRARTPKRGIAVIGHAQQSRRPRSQNQPHAPYYAKVGQKVGAKVFDVHPDHYARMRDPWKEGNQKFLDRAIRRGDRIRLATRVQFARPGSTYAREIAYLKSKGYRIHPGGKWMVPPPHFKKRGRLP
jgi:hypothetical protein